MLIQNWRTAHRLWSVRLAALGSLLMTGLLAFPGVWAGLPSEVRAVLPARLQAVVSMLIFVATLVARVVQQPAAPKPAPPGDAA